MNRVFKKALAYIYRSDTLFFSVVSLAAVAMIFVVTLYTGNTGAPFWDFPVDDAWIHLTYMRGILRDGFPSYNPGVAESGFSSPLWLIAALPAYITGNWLHAIPLWIKGTSALFAIVTLIGAARLATIFTGRRITGIAAIGLLLAWPLFWFSSMSGMEITLAMATITFAVLEWKQTRYLQGGILAALAILSRPEAVCIVFGMTLVQLFSPGSTPKKIVFTTQLVLPSLFSTIIWGTYNFWITGHLLPNTFYVKSTFSLVHNTTLFIPHLLFGHTPATGVGMVMLLTIAAIRLKYVPPHRRLSFAVPILISLLALFAVLATRPVLLHVSFYQTRYYAPFMPMLLAGAVAMLNPSFPRRFQFSSSLGEIGVLLFVIGGIIHLPSQVASYQAHCEEIRALHTVAAKYVQTQFPDDTAIAVEGAGAMSFFSGKTVIDLNGLNNYRIAHGQGGEGLFCQLANHHPSLVAVPSTWHRSVEQLFHIRSTLEFSYAQTHFSSAPTTRRLHIYRVSLRNWVTQRCRVMQTAAHQKPLL
ncbi:MAG: hypothetical protein JXX29_03000 [Deltaproteobacteria bacterium]|nr:hypothetical protein [Deltaproteobacteria bacterium]MBN2670611.1 hypothetical protein [Deltaproteobacteria bacterium]